MAVLVNVDAELARRQRAEQIDLFEYRPDAATLPRRVLSLPPPSAYVFLEPPGLVARGLCGYWICGRR